MFLLVPAYPGCPGSKAVKRSLLLSVCLCVRAFIRVQAFPGRPAVEFPSLPSAMCSFQPPKIGAYIAVYCMQPNNTELMNYGRLVLDGELKVKCDGEKSQMTRYVCGSKYRVGQKTGPQTHDHDSVKS